MFFVPGLIFSIVIKDITHHLILLPLLPVSPSSHLAFISSTILSLALFFYHPLGHTVEYDAEAGV